MKTWKAKKVSIKHDVWVSEIRLKDANIFRKGKVKKLLALLEKEGFDENIL